MKIYNRIEEIFISILVLVSSGMVFINVILRQFNMGMPWTEELIRYLIIWITFLGMSVCVREGSHISIDAIPNMLKGTAKKLLEATVHLLCIVFSLLMTWFSFLFLESLSDAGQLSPALGVPMHYFYFVILISSFVIIFRYSFKLVDVFKLRS